jgi:hypothetical protein
MASKLYSGDIQDVADHIANITGEHRECEISRIGTTLAMPEAHVNEILDHLESNGKAKRFFNGEHTPCVKVTLPKKRPAYVAQIETERDQWQARAQIAEARIEEVIHYLALPKFAGEANNWVNPSDIIARLRADYPIGE